VSVRKKIVVLGMTSRHPVAGMAWLTMQYLIGLERLGYEAYYVEAHGATPKMFMDAGDDGSALAASFIDAMMRRFDLGDRWALHALHSDGRYYGLSELQVKSLYQSATLLLNLHGGTTPLPEHVATGRLVYLGTDPVVREIELHHQVAETIELFAQHATLFTWGENYGQPDCRIPVSSRFRLLPTRQPVVIELWESLPAVASDAFTTIAGWRHLWRDVTLDGELYRWSKHFEFMKFLDLPSRTSQRLELALAGCDVEDRRLLEQHGWRIRDASEVSCDLDVYREYIGGSRAEFTVAKDQNVRLRSGWFSDRSATYLAAGRPVVTQDTGFSHVLPTGQGLFGFSTMDEAVAAVDAINSDYQRHSRAASELARAYFDSDLVLTRLLEDCGV
jgi:hypothetical protein